MSRSLHSHDEEFRKRLKARWPNYAESSPGVLGMLLASGLWTLKNAAFE